MTAPVYGVDELGRPVAWPVDQGHLLTSGTTGSGKSSVARAIVAAAAPDPRVQFVGVDLKAVELAALAPRLAALAVERDEAVDTLTDVGRVLDHRRRIAAGRGWRTWPATPAAPYLAVLVDELSELIAVEGLGRRAEQQSEEAAGQLERTARLGRALGVVIMAATHRPEARAIGGTFRSLFSRRLAMASLDLGSYRLGLGLTDDAPLEHLVVDLSVARPGGAVCLEPGMPLRRVRVFRWSDERLIARLAAHAHLTAPLDLLAPPQVHA